MIWIENISDLGSTPSTSTIKIYGGVRFRRDGLEKGNLSVKHSR